MQNRNQSIVATGFFSDRAKLANSSFEEFKKTGVVNLGGTPSRSNFNVYKDSQFSKLVSIPSIQRHDLTSIPIVEAFDYRTLAPVSTINTPNSLMKSAYKHTATEGALHLADHYKPGSIKFLGPIAKSAESVVESYPRVQKAINDGIPKKEAFICGTIGGVTQTMTAVAGHGTLWTTAGTMIGIDSIFGSGIEGYVAAGTVVTMGSPLVESYSKISGDIFQEACHKTFNLFNKNSSSDLPGALPAVKSSIASTKLRKY